MNGRTAQKDGMVSYAEAIRRIVSMGRILRIETVPLAEARGRVLARALEGREALPPFDNSAMDGFCVRSADTERAAAGPAVRLRVGPTIFAGAPLPADLTREAGALRIMTGAPMPDGFDCVIRFEDATVEKDEGGEVLVVGGRVPVGAHVRKRGEDVAVGDRLLDAGRLLGPGAIAVIAGQGMAEVPVVARPRIRVLATGDELVSDPAKPLGPGQIRNTSLQFLLAEAARLGLPAVSEGLVPDREDDVLAVVRGWLDARRGLSLGDVADPAAPDIVVSTGAVSAGERDFVPSMLERLGFDIAVHGVAVRPGRPVLVASRPGTATLWVGLPGNVLSTAAGFRFFVLPLVRSLLGISVAPSPVRARLASPFPKPAGLRFFARCALRHAGDGSLDAYPERRQGSGMLSALAATDAYAVFPEEPSFIPAGAVIDVEPDAAGLGG